MILKTLIVDDEPLAHEVILEFVKELPFIEIVGQCYSATEALAFLSGQTVDLLFLDIQMPMLTGLELLKLLPNKPQVIITSAYQEYALEGYALDVTDYLLKPFAYDRFLQATSKALSKHQQNTALSAQPVSASLNEPPAITHLFIKVDRKQIQVPLEEICALEAYGNYVKVWRDKQCLLTPKTLTSFEQIVPDETFIRIHKSVIVNKIHIDYLEANTLYLKNGQSHAIGKQHKFNLKQVLE